MLTPLLRVAFGQSWFRSIKSGQPGSAPPNCVTTIGSGSLRRKRMTALNSIDGTDSMDVILSDLPAMDESSCGSAKNVIDKTSKKSVAYEAGSSSSQKRADF